MATTLTIAGRDYSPYLRLYEQQFPVGEGAQYEPILAGAPALSEGQMAIGEAVTNRKWSIPILVKSGTPPTVDAVHALTDEPGIDLWSIVRRHHGYLPLADALYGSAVYVPMADGAERDVTAEAEWRLSNPALAKFVSTARLAPAADGNLTLTAVMAGKQGKSAVKIEDAAAMQPVTFRREILSILTKRGCNSAICHGGVKGQGGFKLSANALHLADDYEWITKGGAYQVLTAEVKGERIPRIDAVKPEKSLLLLKPTMASPHGGGKRFEIDSEDYQTIVGWIRDGANAYLGRQFRTIVIAIIIAVAAGRRRRAAAGYRAPRGSSASGCPSQRRGRPRRRRASAIPAASRPEGRGAWMPSCPAASRRRRECAARRNPPAD